MTRILAYGLEGSGTTVTDSSVRGYDGSLVNGAARIGGKYGNGAELLEASDQYINIPNMSADFPYAQLTVMAWYYYYTYGSTGMGFMWGWADIAFESRNDIGLRFLNTSLVRVFANSGAGVNDGQVPLAQSVPLDTWVHFCVTYDGTTHRVYKDAVEQGSLNLISGPGIVRWPDQGAWGRGGSGEAIWEPMNGIIDECKMFDTALSQPEIEAEMNTPIIGAPAEAARRLMLRGVG